jgi:hypothetical protein
MPGTIDPTTSLLAQAHERSPERGSVALDLKEFREQIHDNDVCQRPVKP